LPDLKVLHDALAWGLSRGALIHEKTGTLFPVEVLGVQAQELIAVAQMPPREVDLLSPPAKIRIELPRDSSVIYVPGRISVVRRNKHVAELEILCADGAEDRARRMDVRIDTECRLRIGMGTAAEQWEETRTVNLAAGGALVVSESRAKIGETVEVQLELGGEVIHCKAEVLRRGVKVNGACPRTSAALKFIGLDDALRDKIALHVLGVHARDKVSRNR
jgi:hypothetical protein